MHEPSHSITVDRASKLIDVRMTGFPTPEDIAWIGEEVRAAVRSLGGDAGKHLTLYDVSAITVVSPATIAAVKETFDNPAVRPLWSRRIAYVVGSALARLQMQQIREVRTDLAVFDNRADALAWLLREGD